MTLQDLSWLDGLLAVLMLLRVHGARQKHLGAALNDLLSIGLLIGLFVGFRIGVQLRDLIHSVASGLEWVPGLGGKLLILVLAWVVLLMIKRRLGYWLEALVPRPAHQFLTLLAEVLRTVLLAWAVVWLLSPWYGDGAGAPLVVQLLR